MFFCGSSWCETLWLWQFAIEHGDLVRGFTHWKWWSSSSLCNKLPEGTGIIAMKLGSGFPPNKINVKVCQAQHLDLGRKSQTMDSCKPSCRSSSFLYLSLSPPTPENIEFELNWVNHVLFSKSAKRSSSFHKSPDSFQSFVRQGSAIASVTLSESKSFRFWHPCYDSTVV